MSKEKTASIQVNKVLLQKYKSQLAKKGKKMKPEIEEFIKSQI